MVDRTANDEIMGSSTARWQIFRRLALQRYPFCECGAVAIDDETTTSRHGS